jgi:hypothetical protein
MGINSPTGTGMGEKARPCAFAGTGTGNFPPRGDGDGEPFRDGEIPVAIPNLSHDSPKDNLRRETQSRLPEATLGRETQARLARGQHRTEDAVTARPRPTLSGRRSHLGRETHSRLARGHPWAGDTVTPRPRPTSGGRGSHASPEAIPERETQSQFVRGQSHTGDIVTSDGRHSHLRRETQSRFTRGYPQAGDAVTLRPKPPLGGRRKFL